MSVKWTRNAGESGILRKSEFKEKKEELFVFGYSCKLFRNDDRALHIDQGKHLIPWMGDETLKIDRYDARGALHDLSRSEAPPGGYDWRVELTKTEYDVEQMCDEERYRALHTDEDEELMYKEEELKRLHAAGYGQVGFNYDAPAETKQEQPPAEIEEPFVTTATFKALFLHDVLFPDNLKQNAIIEKTAKFIATQGTQMEILIKAKQGDNPQFKFLNRDDVLHPYYTALTALVKAGKWPEKEPEVVEEKPQEPDEYLHPSLASTVIESAPSIPSIQYKPSADCDYTMLISKMRCEGETSTLAPGELPPPGTEPAHYPPRVLYNAQVPPPITVVPPQAVYQQYATYHPPVPVPQYTAIPKSEKPLSSLLAHYGSGSETEPSDSEDSASNDKPVEVIPPDDVKLVIEKMSTYVARNGDEFADIVRAKNDPRFTFLDPANIYHPYYNKLMREKRGEINGNSEKKTKPPVSFSIKKLKEPDPILPKPALPYESSSDEDPDKQTDKQADNVEEIKETKPTAIIPQQFNVNTMPQAVIYKMEGQLTQNLPTISTIEHMKPFVAKPVAIEVKETPKPERITIESINKDIGNKKEKVKDVENQKEKIKDGENKKEKIEVVKEKSVSKESSPVVDKIIENKIEKSYENHRKDYSKGNDVKEKDESSNYKREKKRHKERREYISKSQGRDREKRSRSREREKRREKERDREKRKKKVEKDDLESEIISLGDNSDEMIDLTGDLSDSKGEGESEAEKAKQLERRRRAAEFLKKVGVDPAAAALPTNSLASAMVDTLESIRRKKAAEEEKRRRKEKRRRREKREYEESEKSHRKNKRRKYKSTDDDDESDYESSKKKKRKKDKKTSKKKKKRSEPVEEESEMEEDQQLPANMDLSSTLKELRTNSPTKNLMLPDIEENIADETSSEEERGEESPKKKKKKEREYSEGEWSGDSEADSHSSGEERSKMDDRHVGKRSPMEK